MSTSLRTALSWLQAHGLSDEAECWVLGSDTVEPVTGVTSTEAGDMVLSTAPPWSEPTPIPMQYNAVCDTLLEEYAGGGALRWASRPDEPYRGSYVVDATSAVFFLFLPEDVQLLAESHDEKMEQQKQRAKELTKQIQEAQDNG